KCNIAATPTGMAYKIVDGVIQWEATPLDKTADEALADEGKSPEKKGKGPVPEKTRSAMEWLRHQLARGPVRHGQIRTEATGGDSPKMSVGTLYNAMDELHVERFEDEQNKKWLRLSPEAEAQARADLEAQDEADAEPDGPTVLPF
ncbi:MAG: hypothetical protein M3Q75_13505, partial [Gemmatimonadota bacterium]|nr:hypothetical protein [Gemmatimonadota bacterium]